MKGIITDIIDCPQCGLPAQKDNYHIVGEERTVCNWCGYSHTKTINGSITVKGHGSIHYHKDKDNEEKIVRLINPLSLVEQSNVVIDIHKNYDDKSCFYVWNEQLNKLDCICGTLPMTLDQQYEYHLSELEYEKMIQRMSFQGNKDEFEDF